MKKAFIIYAMILLMIMLGAISLAQNATNETSANATANITAGTEVNATVNATANMTTTATSTTAMTLNASNASVKLSIMRWYPKGPDYVFMCDATGFTPTKYTWFFGDGHKLLNIENENTYHVYPALGSYTVSCTASDGVRSASDSMQITVTSLERPANPLFSSFRCLDDVNRNATCKCTSTSEIGTVCNCTIIF